MPPTVGKSTNKDGPSDLMSAFENLRSETAGINNFLEKGPTIGSITSLSISKFDKFCENQDKVNQKLMLAIQKMSIERSKRQKIQDAFNKEMLDAIRSMKKAFAREKEEFSDDLEIFKEELFEKLDEDNETSEDEDEEEENDVLDAIKLLQTGLDAMKEAQREFFKKVTEDTQAIRRKIGSKNIKFNVILHGSRIPMELDSLDTIYTVGMALLKHGGLALHRQRLMLNDKELQYNQTLEEAGIKDGSVIKQHTDEKCDEDCECCC